MTFESVGATQHRMILEYLLIDETMTTVQAREILGVMHPSERVKELKKQGWPVETHWYQLEDVAGKTHRAAQYYLQVEKISPEQIKIREGVLAD